MQITTGNGTIQPMTTQILSVQTENSRQNAIKQAADLLSAGRIVALPTETVYGLAADTTLPEAMLILSALKGRPDHKPFTHAHANQEMAFSTIPRPPLAAVKLARRYWPGPLTLVLADGKGGTVGLRVPENGDTRAILTTLGHPIALPSANPAAEKPARDPAEVIDYFDGRIAAVLDGGRTALGQPSSVVRVATGGVTVLREGALSSEEVFDTAMARILIVCSGNTCRSPMAEAMLRSLIEKRELDGFTVMSAGLHTRGGEPASQGALAAMKTHDIDLTQHRSQTAAVELVNEQDVVYAMTRNLADALRERAEHPERIHMLDPEGSDVRDPFGGSIEEYRTCAEEIQRLIAKRVEEI